MFRQRQGSYADKEASVRRPTKAPGEPIVPGQYRQYTRRNNMDSV